MSKFEESFASNYSFTDPSVDLGVPIREGERFPQFTVRIPLRMMNRHGLIAGATGTGKTRTLQLFTEQLSLAGVPTFVADVKGDLAGMAKPGEAKPFILDRLNGTGREFKPAGHPVEFFSLTGSHGHQLRATVSSFGPMLLGKVLDLTSTQESVLAMVFKYCDDKDMPLLDFADLREVLNYLGGPGKAELKNYGGMSTATVGVLIRKMVELEQQGADRFFGEPALDIKDLIRTDASGRGIVNVLSLADVQDKPRLFSTFLMWLLGRFYYEMPEVGDVDKPKLVFFFDEAHLLFDDASKALTEQIEQVSRLIRSKGIGVFFVTQVPKDVDEDVLAQLGNRVQHALRAFTPADAKNLKATASTFPPSEFYDIQKTLPALGTGEGLVTALNPKGIPTSVFATQFFPPTGSMGTLTEEEYGRITSVSALRGKYVQAIDRESAHEIIVKKLSEAKQVAEQEAPEAPTYAPPAPAARRGRAPAQPKSVVEEVLESRMAQKLGRQAARTITQQVVRGLFGLLKGR